MIANWGSGTLERLDKHKHLQPELCTEVYK